MPFKNRLELIYDSFSFRHREQPGASGLRHVTKTFRSRVLMLWRDQISGEPLIREALGHDPMAEQFWSELHVAMQHLYGRPYLHDPKPTLSARSDLGGFLMKCGTAQFFDAMELSFKLSSSLRFAREANNQVDMFNSMFRVEDLPYEMTHLVEHEETIGRPEESIDEEPASGYSDWGRPEITIVTDAYPQVIRLDEQVPHREAIQPALTALSAPHFKQANDEFRKALRHHRYDEFADCLTACGSALESTLKVICERNDWPYNANATLKPLIETVVGKSSLDPFFKASLEVVGQLRNKWGDAHGRGSDAQPVPGHVAQYGLTSSAAAIILLVTVTEADR